MPHQSLYNISIAALVVMATNAVAQQQDGVGEEAKGFYIGGSLGYARGETGADDINARMAQLGYEANAKVDGQDRAAWSLNAGYRWNTYIETQLGYTDLGEVRTRLSGVAADIDNYLTSANQIHPRSGNGYELTLLGRYPLSDSYYVYGRAGLLTMDSVYRASSNADFARRNHDENTEFVGLGLGKMLNHQWDLRLGIDRYSVEGETIPVLGLGAIYKFGSGKSKVDTKPTSVTTAKMPIEIASNPHSTLEIPPRITLAILFDTDSSHLKEEFVGEIMQFAQFMHTHSSIKVTLEGHTDNRGSDAYNTSLSDRRVQAVKAVLMTRGGIAAERINTIGLGEQQPIADNSTIAGQQANRRVAAVIHQSDEVIDPAL